MLLHGQMKIREKEFIVGTSKSKGCQPHRVLTDQNPNHNHHHHHRRLPSLHQQSNHHHRHRHNQQQHNNNYNQCWRIYSQANASSTRGYKLARISRRRGLILSISLPLFMMFAKVVSANQARCNVVTMFRLKTADCIGRQLTSVPFDLDPDLKVFKLSSNSLISLEYMDFHNYVHLHEISLTQNRIEFIYPSTFAPLKLLQVLDLEGNGLYEIKDYYFANVSSLRVLILKNNPLHRIADQSFQNLYNLELLSLESCFLTSFKPPLMKDLGRLQELNLAHNRLTGLDENMRPFLSKFLTVVRLAGNSWQCDCKFRWFRLWLDDTSVNWNFPKSAPSCSTPEILRGVEWGQLKHDQFTCSARILGNFSSQTVLQASPDDNLTIDCVVFGDPMPSISWLKSNGDRQDHGQNTTKPGRFFAPATYISSLRIFSVSRNDEGDYKCVAENPAGRSEVTFKVIVKVVTDDADVNESWFFRRSSSADVLLGIGVGFSVLIVTILVAALIFLLRNKSSQSRPSLTSQNGSACKRGKLSLTSAEKLQCLESEGTAEDKLLKENYYIFAPVLGDSVRSCSPREARTFRLADSFVFPEFIPDFSGERRSPNTPLAAVASSTTLSSTSPSSSTKTTIQSILTGSSSAVHSDFKTEVSTTRRHFETLDMSSCRRKQHRVNFTLETHQATLRDYGNLSKSSLDCRDKRTSSWWRDSEIENPKAERFKLRGVAKSALKKKKETPLSDASIILSGSGSIVGHQTRNECQMTSSHQARRMSFELAMEEILNSSSRKSNKF